MPRQARVAPGGSIYHVMNRSVAKVPLFRKEAEYAAFEQLMLETQQKHPTRVLGWCLMKSQWNMVIWPEEDGELTGFVRWLTHTHAVRWHAAHGTSGGGHIYQGRFRSFPVEKQAAWTILRHVERAALSAGLIEKAQEWRWGSLWARQNPKAECNGLLSGALGAAPAGWTRQVNAAVDEKEQALLDLSLQRGRPFGSEKWQVKICRSWGLEHTMRPRGRPRGGTLKK